MSTVAMLVGIWIIVIGAWGIRYLSRLRGVQGAWDQATWRRCQNCSGVLVRGTYRGLQGHLGHRLGRADGLTTTEYFKVLVGWL